MRAPAFLLALATLACSTQRSGFESIVPGPSAAVVHLRSDGLYAADGRRLLDSATGDDHELREFLRERDRAHLPLEIRLVADRGVRIEQANRAAVLLAEGEPRATRVSLVIDDPTHPAPRR